MVLARPSSPKPRSESPIRPPPPRQPAFPSAETAGSALRFVSHSSSDPALRPWMLSLSPHDSRDRRRLRRKRPSVGNDSGAVSRVIRPGERLLRCGGAVVSPPPEPAAIVVARLRLEDSGFRLGLDKRFWATKIGPAQLPGGLAHNHSFCLGREPTSLFFLKDQPTAIQLRLFRVANGEEKRRDSGAPALSAQIYFLIPDPECEDDGSAPAY